MAERTGNRSIWTRRQILRMTMAPLFTSIAAACVQGQTVSENIFIDEAEKFEEISRFSEGVNPYKSFRELNPQDKPLDLSYVSSLFGTLEAQRGNRDTRQKAILNNLHRIISKIHEPGSVFQIDDAGVYLTVAHAIMDLKTRVFDPPPIIYHPTSGAGFRVNTIFCDPDKDIAIIYAPSGRNRRAVEGLKISTSEIPTGATLWVLGLRPQRKGSEWVTERGIVKGTVELYVDADWVKVKDMRPFGSSSGGPAINSEGELVGIEQGSYGERGGQNLRANYKGGLIVPISSFKSMVSDPKVMMKRYTQ